MAAKAPIPETEFVTLFREIGPDALAKKLGLNVRSVFDRRLKIEVRTGQRIEAPTSYQRSEWRQEEFPGRRGLKIKEGVVIVAGDAHYWPGDPSLMHRALVHMVRRFAGEKVLRAVVMNGDVTDFPRLSRF